MISPNTASLQSLVIDYLDPEELPSGNEWSLFGEFRHLVAVRIVELVSDENRISVKQLVIYMCLHSSTLADRKGQAGVCKHWQAKPL